MRRNRKENMWNQVQRFSIRKFSFGVTSALLGTVFLANASMVHAETGNVETLALAVTVEASNGNSTTSESAETTNADSATSEKAEVEKNTLPAAVKPEENSNQALSSERITEDKKVNKNELTEKVEKLSNLLNKVNRDRAPKTSVLDLETTLSKAQEVLQNDSATQLEVDRQVRKVKDALFIVQSMPKVDVETSQTEEENGVVTEQPKTVAELKRSLELVKKDFQEYLNKVETETDNTTATAAKEMIASISTQLENASATVEELTALLKQATPVRNSLVNEVLRENQGKNHPLNGKNMGEGISDVRSVPIDITTNRGELGIVVANSGFITGYATPSSKIEIKRNGTTVLTSKLDDTGAFKLNAPGIAVGDVVELVVNGQTVTTTTVKQTDTVAFNDSLAGIAQVDGYTAAEADVEVTVGGKTYTTRSQTNGYFTVNVDTNLMVNDAVVKTVIKKNGQIVGSGTSTVRNTKVTDFGVGWIKNPMINYSHRDVFSPDTKQYAFVSKGTADQAYDNIRVYREMRIENNGKYYYWILDSGPWANAQAGLSKKISLAIPRTVGDPYEFTYTKYQNGKQISHKDYVSATAWEHDNSTYRAYVKNGVPRSGATYGENSDAWMDYINPSNTWWWNIYHDDPKDGTDRNKDAASRVSDMLSVYKNGLDYNLTRGIIEDKMNVKAGQRTIITFKTKILEGEELNNSIMSDWANKNANDPMLAEIKNRLANDPFLAFGGYTEGGYNRYKYGQNAIIGVLPLKPDEANRYNLKPTVKEQTTNKGVVPPAINSIANIKDLPAGTTYRWFKDPDVSKATEPNKPVYGKVEVIIPERGTYIVDAPVNVLEEKEKTPEAPSALANDDGSVTVKP